MNKYFHGLLFGVSVLPALAIMPALGLELDLYGEDNNIQAGVYENAPRRYIWVNADATVNIQAGAIFRNNRAEGNDGSSGGAILNEETLNILGDSGNRVEFISNYTSVAGGAICSYTNLEVKNSLFDSNEAQKTAGAIDIIGNANIIDSIFQKNIAHGEQDGEGQDTFVYVSTSNGKTYDAESGAVGISAGSNVTITGSSFEENVAGIGGALGNGSMVTVNNSTFNKNYAASQGGAIINFLYNKSTQTVQDIKETINNVSFTQNHAKSSGGAISTFSMSDITNSQFIGNYTESASFGDGGGAMFVGAESITKIKDSLFENNTSASAGGAIMTRSADIANNSAAKLDITETTFKNNTAATTGGALDTYFYNSEAKEFQIYVDNSTFEGNAAAQGGAIFNHGLEDRGGNKASMHLNSVTFTGNTAVENGGAIYNESAVELAGTNTFTGNKANGTANDIHNLGSLTIASGTTTMDGGITGDGELVIANGATLNIGIASVSQDTITLNGTLLATVRDGDAQITAGTFGGNGTLSLVFNDEGTYHVFGDDVFANAKSQVSSTIYDLTWINEDKDVTATLKSAANLAQENNLSSNDAAAILGMTQSSSEKLNDIAVKLQEKLAEATPEAQREVEHAAKAVHPETESVTQSMTTAVQTAVTNLAGARMAAPTIGRNGGDITMTSGGVWAQGLFNKSKQNDAFHGYTRGIAAGMDGTLNKVWTVGAGYSYAHSDVTGLARDTEIDSNTVFLYGQYKPAEWYVNAVANYTMADYSEEGAVMGNPVTADYDVDSFGLSVATGYDLDFGLTPELGLRYMYVMADDYTNSLGVKTKSDNTNFLTGVLGAKYAFNVQADRYTSFIPQLNAAIKYDMLSDKNVATVTMPGVDAYTLDVERLSRFGGEFGIGLGMKHRGLDFSINYDIDVRKDYTSQTGMLKFRYNF